MTSSSTIPTNERERERDPFAIAAIAFAVILLLLPTVEGLQVPAFLSPSVSGLLKALGLQIVASGFVATITLLSYRRIRRNPERLRGFGLLIASTAIILLDIAGFTVVFTGALMRM